MKIKYIVVGVIAVSGILIATQGINLLEELSKVRANYVNKLNNLSTTIHQKSVALQNMGGLNTLPMVQHIVRKHVLEIIDECVAVSEAIIRDSSTKAGKAWLWLLPTTVAFEEHELAALKAARASLATFVPLVGKAQEKIDKKSTRLLAALDILIEGIKKLADETGSNTSAQLNELFALSEIKKAVSGNA